MRAAGVGTCAAVVAGVLSHHVLAALVIGLCVTGLLAIEDVRRRVR